MKFKGGASEGLLTRGRREQKTMEGLRGGKGTHTQTDGRTHAFDWVRPPVLLHGLLVLRHAGGARLGPMGRRAIVQRRRGQPWRAAAH